MSRPEALNVEAAARDAGIICDYLNDASWRHAVSQHEADGSLKYPARTLAAIRWRPTERQKEEARYAAALLLRVANDDGKDFTPPTTTKAKA